MHHRVLYATHGQGGAERSRKFFGSRGTTSLEEGRSRDEIGRKRRNSVKLKGSPLGTISRVGTWHSPLSSARNSCWSCSLVGSELDLVPVCFVEDSISFILFLAWWPRNAACILVAAFSLSFSESSPFFSSPFDSASFFSFESPADLFCDDSCESTFAGLLSPFVISENSRLSVFEQELKVASNSSFYDNFQYVLKYYKILL